MRTSKNTLKDKLPTDSKEKSSENKRLPYTMKAVTLDDGKLYIETHERILFLKNSGIDYDLTANYEIINDRVIVKAVLTIHDGNNYRVFTGMASKPLKAENSMQWCETVAWGRACAAFGIGIDTSIASAEEMRTVIDPQKDMLASVAMSPVALSESIASQVSKKSRKSMTNDTTTVREG